MTAINLKTLGRSSITGALSQAWRILSRFILTPIIIGQLGMEGYGVWTLVFSVAAYVQMTNASVGLAYTKFTAECVRRGRFEELSYIIGSGMTGLGSIAVAFWGLAWIFGEPVMAWLNVPAPLLDDSVIALLLVIGALVLRMTVGCTNEILAGLQRIDLTYRLHVLASLVEFAVVVPALLLGYGLVGLAAGHVIGQIVADLVAYVMVRRRLPEVRISPFLVSRDGFAKIFSVGGRFQLLWLVNTVVMQGAKLLISKLVGVEWVGIYELADKLINLGKTASEAVVAPLMPAFASLRAAGEKARERMLFLKGSKADALMGGASFTFLALFAPAILLVWTGEEVPQAAWTLRVLALGEASLLLTSVVSSNLRSQGQVRLELTWALVTTGILVALVIPLGPLMGFEGVIYARLLAQLIGTAWYLRAYFRVAGITWGEYLGDTRIPWLAAILAVIGALMLTLYALLPTLAPPGLSERFTAVFELLVWTVPFFALLTTAVWKIYLTPSDREQLLGFLTLAWDKLRNRESARPDVLVVAEAGLARAGGLIEAAEVLGRVEVMSLATAGDYLATGAQVRLVLVQLGPGGDPNGPWDWLHSNRPDLVARLAFVSAEDHPLYERPEVRRYAEDPDGEALRADFGGAARPAT